MSQIIEALLQRRGRYRGEGVNHEQQGFIGELELESIVEGRGVCITFKATGIEDGEVYHQEHTLIAPAASGNLSLVTLSSNAGELQTLGLRRQGSEEGSEDTFVFGDGAPDAKDTMRIEMAIDLWPKGELSYRFAWGLPGGEFAPRSAVRMRQDHHGLAVPS